MIQNVAEPPESILSVVSAIGSCPFELQHGERTFSVVFKFKVKYTLGLVSTDKAVAIASGGKKPSLGIPSMRRLTRSVEDKSSFGNPGIGMPVNKSDRRWVDPPKNLTVLGETGLQVRFAYEHRSRSVNAGNGSSSVARILSNSHLKKSLI